MNKNILVELETQNDYEDIETSYFFVKIRDIEYHTKEKRITETIFIIIDFLGYGDESEKYTYIKTDSFKNALEIFCETVGETLVSFKVSNRGIV